MLLNSCGRFVQNFYKVFDLLIDIIESLSKPRNHINVFTEYIEIYIYILINIDVKSNPTDFNFDICCQDHRPK